jgi:hypothetical protein
MWQSFYQALTRRKFLQATALAALPAVAAAAPDKDDIGKIGKVTVEQLLKSLASEKGDERVAATKELLRRGKAVADDLKKAGAKQPQTIATRRLDLVYGLLVGLEPGNYTKNSFGIHVEKGTTEEDVQKMGKKYGFTVSGPFRPDTVPNCYVTLEAGKSPVDVMKAILTTQPQVLSLNLNYYEKSRG